MPAGLTAARLGGPVLAAATVAGCGSSTAAGAGRPSVPDQAPATAAAADPHTRRAARGTPGPSMIGTGSAGNTGAG